MKKRLSIIFSVYFVILLFGIFSCDKFGTDCGPFPDRYKTISLDWYVYEAEFSNTEDPHLILTPTVNDTISYHQYSIVIYPERETYYSVNNRTRSFNLINVAYACSPVDPITDEKLEDIQVFCEKDFNSNYKVGSNLAKLFDVVVFDYSIGDLTKLALVDYLSTKPAIPYDITLLLNEAPDKSSNYVFTVKYFQDGIDMDYFEFETNSILIIKD